MWLLVDLVGRPKYPCFLWPIFVPSFLWPGYEFGPVLRKFRGKFGCGAGHIGSRIELASRISIASRFMLRASCNAVPVGMHPLVRYPANIQTQHWTNAIFVRIQLRKSD